jgi:lipopolysaccharide transport system permease protein
MAMATDLQGSGAPPAAVAQVDILRIEPTRGWVSLHLGELWKYRELLYFLVWRDIKVRYKQTALGAAWAIIQPFFTMVVFSLFFGKLAKVPSDGIPYPIFAYVALVPWTFFADGLAQSSNSLVSSANLIKKVYFPRELLVLSILGSVVVTLLIELSVLGVVLLAFGNMVLPWIPVVLVLVVLLATMMLGIGLMLSIWNVYFRDVKHFVNIALQALFYSAPIVYPGALVPKHKEILGINVPVSDLYRLNPLVRYVEAFRSVLYDLKFPSLGTFAYLLGCSLGALALGLFAFRRLEPRLAEEV